MKASRISSATFKMGEEREELGSASHTLTTNYHYGHPTIAVRILLVVSVILRPPQDIDHVLQPQEMRIRAFIGKKSKNRCNWFIPRKRQGFARSTFAKGLPAE